MGLVLGMVCIQIARRCCNKSDYVMIRLNVLIDNFTSNRKVSEIIKLLNLHSLRY